MCEGFLQYQELSLLGKSYLIYHGQHFFVFKVFD